jgi:hypothetical protein
MGPSTVIRSMTRQHEVRLVLAWASPLQVPRQRWLGSHYGADPLMDDARTLMRGRLYGRPRSVAGLPPRVVG